MNTKSCIMVLFFMLFPIGTFYAQGNTGNIELIITGFKNSSGHAGVTLFASEKGFPMKHKLAIKEAFAAIDNGVVKVIFENIPYGKYAVSVFHDENDNKALEQNLIGMPKEGVGTSNNAKGRFGPPKFKDASFELNSDKHSIAIQMVYLNSKKE